MKYSDKDYDNTKFYKSKAWRNASRTYMQGQLYRCERCGSPATICHHRIWLDGRNIHDINLALGADNLEALCHACHNTEHASKNSRTLFSEEGEIETVKESPAINEFKSAQEKIDNILKKLKKT